MLSLNLHGLKEEKKKVESIREKVSGIELQLLSQVVEQILSIYIPTCLSEFKMWVLSHYFCYLPNFDCMYYLYFTSLTCIDIDIMYLLIFPVFEWALTVFDLFYSYISVSYLFYQLFLMFPSRCWSFSSDLYFLSSINPYIVSFWFLYKLLKRTKLVCHWFDQRRDPQGHPLEFDELLIGRSFLFKN